ncbi:MAG: hypothetical protein ACI39F_03500 [Acutalibacteraceae bacterium]
MKSIKTALLLFIIILCVLPISVSAETKEITKTATFSTSLKPFEYDFDKTIIQDGLEYTLERVDYEELNENGEAVTTTVPDTTVSTTTAETTAPQKLIEKEVTYKNLPSKKCNAKKTITVKNGGKKIKLKLQNIEYTEVNGDDITKTVTSTTDLGKNSKAPPTKVINSDGQSVTVYLQDVKEVAGSDWSGKWSKTITTTEYNKNYFSFSGYLFPKKGSLNINGFGKGLLNAVGLNSNNYKATSVRWSGAEYDSGGTKYRKAIVSGVKLTETKEYKAYYSGTVTVKGKKTYTAVCFYQGFTDDENAAEQTSTASGTEVTTTETTVPGQMWEVKATAHYVFRDPESFITQNIAYIKLGCILIIGIVIFLIVFKIIKKIRLQRSEYEE